MIAPLNCDECKMQARCTCVSTDCKYPEGRQYGVTTYDKMRADERSALEKRLEEAERVIDTLVYEHAHLYDTTITASCILQALMREAEDYRAKYSKGGE